MIEKKEAMEQYFGQLSLEKNSKTLTKDEEKRRGD